MTKLEIYDSLLIIRESLRLQAKNHYSQSDEPDDYHFGYAKACETYAERVESLFKKVKADVQTKAR